MSRDITLIYYGVESVKSRAIMLWPDLNYLMVRIVCRQNRESRE